MFLVTLVLHDPDLLEEVIQAWENIGVQRATVLSSTGMGRLKQSRVVRDDLPLLPSLSDFYEAASQTLSRTIFTALKDESLIERIVAVTEELIGDMSQPNTGILFITPILRAYGLEKETNNVK